MHCNVSCCSWLNTFPQCPHVPLLPSLSVTHYCKNHLIGRSLLPLWLTHSSAVVFGRLASPCVQHNLIWTKAYTRQFDVPDFQDSALLTFAFARRRHPAPPSFSAHCSKPEPNKRRNSSATPCLRRSRPSRRRRKRWRSTMKRRRNFSRMSCQGNSCK